MINMNAPIAARMKIAIIIGAAMETTTVDVICWGPLPVGVGSSGRDEDEETDEGGKKSLVGSGDSWVGEGSTWLAEEVCGVVGVGSDEGDVPYELLVMAAGVDVGRVVVGRVVVGRVVVGGGGSGLAACVLKKATCGLSRILCTAPRR